MIGIVIACHLDMAKNLLETVSYVFGETPKNTHAVSIELSTQNEELKLQLALAINEVDSGDGVIVLTDIIGGTPSVIAREFLSKKNVEVVTGVNLPMVLATVNYREEMSLKRLSKMAVKAGKASILSLGDTKKG
jgi:mannose/fructose/sorbose-specific phosphotransferase system IIA component